MNTQRKLKSIFTVVSVWISVLMSLLMLTRTAGARCHELSDQTASMLELNEYDRIAVNKIVKNNQDALERRVPGEPNDVNHVAVCMEIYEGSPDWKSAFHTYEEKLTQIQDHLTPELHCVAVAGAFELLASSQRCHEINAKEMDESQYIANYVLGALSATRITLSDSSQEVRFKSLTVQFADRRIQELAVKTEERPRYCKPLGKEFTLQDMLFLNLCETMKASLGLGTIPKN